MDKRHTFTSNPFISNLSIKKKCFSMCFNDNYMKYARENKPIWIKLDNILNLSMTKCLFNNK